MQRRSRDAPDADPRTVVFSDNLFVLRDALLSSRRRKHVRQDGILFRMLDTPLVCSEDTALATTLADLHTIDIMHRGVGANPRSFIANWSDAKGKFENTLLNKAIQAGAVKTCASLLQASAFLDATDGDGYSCFHVLAGIHQKKLVTLACHSPIVTKVALKGYNITSDIASDLFAISMLRPFDAFIGTSEKRKALLKSVLSIRNADGHTAMDVSILTAGCPVRVIRWLISRGSPIDRPERALPALLLPFPSITPRAKQEYPDEITKKVATLLMGAEVVPPGQFAMTTYLGRGKRIHTAERLLQLANRPIVDIMAVIFCTRCRFTISPVKLHGVYNMALLCDTPHMWTLYSKRVFTTFMMCAHRKMPQLPLEVWALIANVAFEFPNRACIKKKDSVPWPSVQELRDPYRRLLNDRRRQNTTWHTYDGAAPPAIRGRI